jgi:hypothetical protein
VLLIGLGVRCGQLMVNLGDRQPARYLRQARYVLAG